MWAGRRAGSQFGGDILQVSAEPAGRSGTSSSQGLPLSVPHLRNLLKNGSGLDAPAVKGNAAPGSTRPSVCICLAQTLSCVVMMIACRGTRFKKPAELLAMVLVDGTHHIVKHGEAGNARRATASSAQSKDSPHPILVPSL